MKDDKEFLTQAKSRLEIVEGVLSAYLDVGENYQDMIDKYSFEKKCIEYAINFAEGKK